MAPLAILLLIKIVGTLVPVALPMLLFSKARFDELSGFGPSDLVLYRVYGMAVLALLVGYSGGLLQVRAGVFPHGVLAMGFVSNAGAAALLFFVAEVRHLRRSSAFFALIAIGLAFAFFLPDAAMAPLW